MLIGTFHSICLQILRDYAHEAGLKNIDIINDFDALYVVKRNYDFEKKLFDSKLFKNPWYGFSSGYWLAKDFISLVDAASVM